MAAWPAAPTVRAGRRAVARRSPSFCASTFDALAAGAAACGDAACAIDAVVCMVATDLEAGRSTRAFARAAAAVEWALLPPGHGADTACFQRYWERSGVSLAAEGGDGWGSWVAGGEPPLPPLPPPPVQDPALAAAVNARLDAGWAALNAASDTNGMSASAAAAWVSSIAAVEPALWCCGGSEDGDTHVPFADVAPCLLPAAARDAQVAVELATRVLSVLGVKVAPHAAPCVSAAAAAALSERVPADPAALLDAPASPPAWWQASSGRRDAVARLLVCVAARSPLAADDGRFAAAALAAATAPTADTPALTPNQRLALGKATAASILSVRRDSTAAATAFISFLFDASAAATARATARPVLAAARTPAHRLSVAVAVADGELMQHAEPAPARARAAAAAVRQAGDAATVAAAAHTAVASAASAHQFMPSSAAAVAAHALLALADGGPAAAAVCLDQHLAPLPHTVLASCPHARSLVARRVGWLMEGVADGSVPASVAADAARAWLAVGGGAAALAALASAASPPAAAAAAATLPSLDPSIVLTLMRSCGRDRDGVAAVARWVLALPPPADAGAPRPADWAWLWRLVAATETGTRAVRTLTRALGAAPASAGAVVAFVAHPTPRRAIGRPPWLPWPTAAWCLRWTRSRCGWRTRGRREGG